MKKADQSVFLQYDAVINEIKEKFNISALIKEKVPENVKEEVERVSEGVIQNYNKVVAELQKLQSKVRNLTGSEVSFRRDPQVILREVTCM